MPALLAALFAALLLLYCCFMPNCFTRCFTAALCRTALLAALLLLYCCFTRCFTAALLLLYAELL
jgi:hypothetical protein